MRGRTNIVQRSGTVSINGQVKQYEVETGNTISVGDFVSFSRNIDEPIDVKSTKTYSLNVIYKGNDFIIQRIIYTDSMVVQVVKDGVVKNSMSFANNYEAVYLSSSSKLIVGYRGNYSVYYIDVLTYNINLLLNGEYLSNLQDFDQWQVFELGDKFVTLYILNNKVRYYINSISDENVISLVSSKTDVSNAYFSEYGIGFYKNGVLSVLCWGKVSNSYRYPKIVYFDFDGTNLTPIGYSSDISVVVSKPSLPFVNYFDDKILVTFPYSYGANYSTESSNNTTKYIILNFNDNKLSVVNSFALNGYIGSTASTNYPYISNGYITSLIPIGSNKFICLASSILKNNDDDVASSVGKNNNYSILFYCIYELQDSLPVQITNWQEIIRINKQVMTRSLYYIKHFLNNFMCYYLRNGIYYCYLGLDSAEYNAYNYLGSIILITFELVNNDLDFTNKVTSYNGKALGFAKTGGSAGQTIEVYVPYES